MKSLLGLKRRGFAPNESIEYSEFLLALHVKRSTFSVDLFTWQSR
jgi:hypothetical protein